MTKTPQQLTALLEDSRRLQQLAQIVLDTGELDVLYEKYKAAQLTTLASLGRQNTAEILDAHSDLQGADNFVSFIHNLKDGTET